MPSRALPVLALALGLLSLGTAQSVDAGLVDVAADIDMSNVKLNKERDVAVFTRGCFKVNRVNKGILFRDVDDGYVPERCPNSDKCFTLRPGTANDLRQVRAFACVDKSKQKRCLELVQCDVVDPPCDGQRWVESECGIDLIPATPEDGAISLEMCDKDCFKIRPCTGKLPCYNIADCQSRPGEKSCRRLAPCVSSATGIQTTTDSPTTTFRTTTTAPCDGELFRPVRVPKGFKLKPVDGPGILWKKCPHSDRPDCIEELKCDGTGNERCQKKVRCKSKKNTCLELEPCEDATTTTKVTPTATEPCEGKLLRTVKVPVGFQLKAVNGPGIFWRNCPGFGVADCFEELPCDGQSNVQCQEKVDCVSDAAQPRCLRITDCDATTTTTPEVSTTTAPCQDKLVRPVKVPVGFQLRPVDGPGIFWRKCPNALFSDCIEELRCDGQSGVQCQQKVDCASNTFEPSCLQLVPCEERTTEPAPCEGMVMEPADSGFSLASVRKGIRFRPCAPNSNCMVKEDCVATVLGTNNCVEIVPDCTPNSGTQCFQTKPCRA